jgi:hypothetical protein
VHLPRLAVVPLLACAAAASAQQPAETPKAETAPEAAPPAETAPAAPPQRPITYSLGVRGDFNFNAGLSDAPGNVTVTRADLSFDVGIPVGLRGQFGISLDAERSNYNFTDATTFVPNDPDTNFDANITSLSFSFARQENETWGWLAGGGFGAGFESGAHIDQSLFATAFGGVRYAINEKVRISLGAIVTTQIEDNPLILPLLGLDWRFDERTSLSSEGKPGLTLAYALDSSWIVRTGFTYESRNFRLDRDGPIPNGVARDTRLPVFIGIRYAPNRQIDIDLVGGVMFMQTLEVDDSEGVELSEEDVDTTPFLRISVAFKF